MIQRYMSKSWIPGYSSTTEMFQLIGTILPLDKLKIEITDSSGDLMILKIIKNDTEIYAY